jgi:hypothetical protein
MLHQSPPLAERVFSVEDYLNSQKDPSQAWRDEKKKKFAPKIFESLADLKVGKSPPRNLSPASINLFLEEPALWLIERFFYVFGEGSVKMHIGNAFEAEIQARLLGLSESQAAMVSRSVLGTKIAEDELPVEPAEFEQLLISVTKRVNLAYPWMASLGKLKKTQETATLALPYLSRPIIGYTDFRFDNSGFAEDFGPQTGWIVDTKSTDSMPAHSEAKEEHLRAMALYLSHFTNCNGAFVYASDKRMIPLPYARKDLQGHLNHLIAGAKAIDNIIQVWSTLVGTQRWRAIADMYPPRTPNGFRWDDKRRFIASLIWGTPH